MLPIAVHVADGRQTPLTDKRWNYTRQVAWLADGSGILMNANDLFEVNSQLWHISFPGGVPQRIYNDLNRYEVVSLAKNSDTLVSVQVESRKNIYTVSPFEEPRRVTQITKGTERDDGALTFTPDGKIVFVSQNGGSRDLWMMDADGGNQKQLTDDEPANRFPSLTPDGRYIVFDSLGRGGVIWRMDSDGGNIKRLADRGSTPHRSSDGKWVTYQQGQSAPSVWKVSIDGGQPVRITDKLTIRPAFSPDGKQIACFYKEESTSPWKIAIFPSEGGQPVKVFDRQVTVGKLFFVLRWTPDGRAILFTDETGGVSNLWSQPVDGGKPAQVTDFKSDLIYTFDLSPDGRWLAITRGTVSGDVVMMSSLGQ